MEQITIFNYGSAPISFSNGEDKYINATEMAKPFGKLASGWLRNQSTQDFINEYCAMRNRIPSDLVQVTNGDNGGTWMHEDVAMEFARWLSPKFAIWCNDRIKELMKHGITATQPTIDSILADPTNAIKMLQALQEERAKTAALQEQNAQKQQQLEAAQPMVNFAKAVENSDTLILIRDLAKILKQHGYDTGEKRLFETLRRDGYLTLTNMPTQKSMEIGLMRIAETVVQTTYGSKTMTTAKITGKGQVYFLNRYAKLTPIEAQNVLHFENEEFKSE